MMQRVATISLVLAAVSCGEPMIWIGEVIPDAGASALADGGSHAAAPSPAERDAGLDRDGAQSNDTLTARMTQRDAGATQPEPPPTKAGPRATDPPEPKDAGTPEPADDADGGSAPPQPSDVPTEFPTAAAPCPVMNGPGTYTFGTAERSLDVRVFMAPDAKSKPGPGGPLIMYWHALGTTANEVFTGLGQQAIDDVVAKGGVVGSFVDKYCRECGSILTSELVWYIEDSAASDHFVACALEQAKIDRRRIHSMGLSAGAIRSIDLAIGRSNFIASVVSYSGGDRTMGMGAAQDPTNKVPSILLYGGALDVVGMNFPALAREWYEKRRPNGWYTMICNHNAGHIIPSNFGRHAYRFLLDHPYKVSPEPYAMKIPEEFPDYCGNEFR